MFYFIVLILFVFLSFRYGDLKNWSKYHATILYFILSDVIYNFLAYNKPLWTYTSTWFNHTVITLLIAMTLYPCTVLIYIYHYPKLIRNQILYVSMWNSIYLILEFLSYKFRYLIYSNGWNIYCSALSNYIMFTLLYLNYKKPMLSYILTLIGGIVTLVLFDISLAIMK